MTPAVARGLLVGVAVLLAFAAGRQEGATTSAAVAGSSSGPALASSNELLLSELCFEGPLHQTTAATGRLEVGVLHVCFPNEGGEVAGTFELETTFRGVGDCVTIASAAMTLSGSYSPGDPPSLAGTYDGRARLDVSPDCTGVTSGETDAPSGSWDGTIEGGRLRIVIHSEGQPDVILEGVAPAGDTDSQPEEDAGDQPADDGQAEPTPTTNPLSAALAELFAGAGDWLERSNAYARARGAETVIEASDVGFRETLKDAFHESIGSPTTHTDAQKKAEAGIQAVAQYASAKDGNGTLLFPSIFKALPVFGRLAQKAADGEDPSAQLAFDRFFLLLMDLDIQAGEGQ